MENNQQKEQPSKVGFFFGAGAEVSYGLPSGGRFALDIFRGNAEEEKKFFRSMELLCTQYGMSMQALLTQLRLIQTAPSGLAF